MVLALVLGLAAAIGRAQEPDGPPPRDEDRLGPSRNDDDQALTAEQVAKVKAILSKYDASSLNSKDARAINDAFRAAGLRNGPGLQDAIRAAGFVPKRIGELDPPRDRPADNRPPQSDRRDGRRRESHDRETGSSDRRPPRQGGGYSIEQAISDRAQLTTIAFSGLAFLTGDLGCNTFLPPGKVADFCGFQYMRDVDSNQLGHNTSFVPRAANNVLHVLTDRQKAQLVALAKEQEKLLTSFAYKRFPLIKAFFRQLKGDLPSGSTGLNRQSVMQYTADLYEIDGLLSYRRAEVLGGIIRSLSDKQKQYLGKMVFNDSATWPERGNELDRRSLSHTAHVAVMTYASEMFSWYAGNVSADVYFCPERHATCFGSFYMKDIPAMGNPNFSISTSLTGDSGEAFLDTLTESQRTLITGLVNLQRADLEEIVKTRRSIATELRRFMKEPSIDKGKVMQLSRRYGELDGEISYFCTMAYAEVAKTLTAKQKQALLKLRNLDAKYTCRGAYLYSQPIDMPEIPNTDFLFFKSERPRPASASDAAAKQDSFTLASPEIGDDGQLPRDYTGDGTAATLPLQWSGTPPGTKSFALIMHHVPQDGGTKWYWVLYNIPPGTTGLPKNVRGIGTLGNNGINGRTEYAPPRSKGPGPKTYVYTVYALSSPVIMKISPSEVSRDLLLSAMKDKILASAELRVVYTRDVPNRPERPD
jgi:phosphatidylethanolamine-binding protein (PEBP) family uncharacterized protein